METLPTHNPTSRGSSTTLVQNGAVDLRRRIADKSTTGGWKAAPFVIVNEVAERMAFYAISLNMVIFLSTEMNQSLPEATTNVTNWTGTAFVLTLFGAFLADSYLGRFHTILIFSSVYVLGIVLLTFAASFDSLRPPACAFSAGDCRSATVRQNVFLYSALYLIAIGTGGIKPNISSFGADQFDEFDPKEAIKKLAFFNWFYFSISFGVLLGLTIVAYVEDRKGWGYGFGMSAAATIASMIALLVGIPFFRQQFPRGSPFTRFLQVIVAACCNHFNGVRVNGSEQLFEVTTTESAIFGARKLPHTRQFQFLDKAAALSVDCDLSKANRWKLCTVTQVEEFKSLLRVLPIWASSIVLYLVFSQLNLFVLQAIIMNRHIGPNFVVPAGSVSIFIIANPLIVVPVFEAYGVKFFKRFTGHPRGLSSLQRMGIGLALSITSLVIAAVIERHRRSSLPKILPFWWLLPQYFLLGASEVFGYVAQLEFFYNQATDGTRSLSSALPLSLIGVGSWLTTLLIKTVVKTTGGVEKGWLRKDLNQSKLDYYYWIVCGIASVNFVVYLVVAYNYKDNEELARVSEEAKEKEFRDEE